MIRQEQIEQDSRKTFPLPILYNEEQQKSKKYAEVWQIAKDNQFGFVRGAAWADEHPKQKPVKWSEEDRNIINKLICFLSSYNAQALMTMSHKRLCGQADLDTRKIMQMIVKEVLKTNPEFEGVLVPNCQYLHRCPEFFPCGRYKAE